MIKSIEGCEDWDRRPQEVVGQGFAARQVKLWMPIKWSVSIVRKAMKEKRLANPPTYASLVKAIAAFRKSLTEVVTYGHVTVPLVYTQV